MRNFERNTYFITVIILFFCFIGIVYMRLLDNNKINQAVSEVEKLRSDLDKVMYSIQTKPDTIVVNFFQNNPDTVIVKHQNSKK